MEPDLTPGRGSLPASPRNGAYFPELRRVLAGNSEALAALYRLEASLAPVLATVERYGRMWAKDTDYYDSAKALGICSCGGIDAVSHATDHRPDCDIWGPQ